MAKPQHPLLSFGARGSIADTLTFQKRGKLTIARQKPIPTDPKSPAQLAQRQIYREAVDAWNALSPEEKEAWRGVCPALTPFQCFMRYKMDELLHPPTPEEYTEEQTEHDSFFHVYLVYPSKAGQRLVVPNRKITKLGFWLYKWGEPTGDVTFEIHRISPDELICSKVWGDVSDLPAEPTYEEVTFNEPTLVDEEVRIVACFEGGNGDKRLCFRRQSSDVKADESFTRLQEGTWADFAVWDAAYRYKYYLP